MRAAAWVEGAAVSLSASPTGFDVTICSRQNNEREESLCMHGDEKLYSRCADVCEKAGGAVSNTHFRTVGPVSHTSWPRPEKAP